MYSDGGWSRTFLLGEHQETPLYAVRLHSGWSGEPAVVLHTGPDPDRSPVVAAVDFERWTGDMVVTLPPLQQPQAPGPAAAAANELRVEADLSFHRVFRFVVEVGGAVPSAPPMRPEMFEWRHSYGDAIADLGGSSEGWKLVRIDTAPPPGVSTAFRPGGYITSDGREVVAAWSAAVMSMTKRAKFAFLGTGRSGVLGERWAVAAVMTALGIWERERRRRRDRR